MSDNYVVLDCDTGSDDAWALLALLKADAVKKVKLLGVTCVNGNTDVDNAIQNTLTVLELCGRGDIPVFKGSVEPIIRKPSSKDLLQFHGKDGFGDLPNRPTTKLSSQSKSAVHALYDFASMHPGQVTFLCIGPLTNTALCLKVYPDFASKIKSMYIMGGNINAVGNITKTAEFNFYADPEAAQIVLEQTIFPIHILPWEACLGLEDPITLDWRLKVVGSVGSKVVDLLNLVEESQYIPKGYSEWIPCDLLVIIAYLNPDFVLKESKWHTTVELSGEHTRGQMILDHMRSNKENTRILEKWDSNLFRTFVMWIVDHKDTSIFK